jgi:hypothetical protein
VHRTLHGLRLVRTSQLASLKIGKLRRIPVDVVHDFARRMIEQERNAACAATPTAKAACCNDHRLCALWTVLVIGHSAIEMSMNIYGHVNLETQRAALKQLDDEPSE